MQETKIPKRLLKLFVHLASVYPWSTVVLALVLAIASLFYTARGLGFRTSRQDLLSPHARYIQLYKEYSRDFGDLEVLVIAVEGSEVRRVKAFADSLSTRLKADSAHVRRISYKVSPDDFKGKALLYLSEKELANLAKRLGDSRDLLEEFPLSPQLSQLLTFVNREISSALVGHLLSGLLGGETKKETAKGRDPVDLGFLSNLLTQMVRQLERPTPYVSPWESMLIEKGGLGGNQYFLSDDERFLFVFVEPVEKEGSFTGAKEAIAAIRRTVREVQKQFPEIQAGVTGLPALANDEMVRALPDSTLATVIAFAATLVLLVIPFRRMVRPLLALLVLATAIAWTLGFVTLTIGYLTIFSVVFVSMVVGIGIDYGIYLLARYEEERFLGRSLWDALETTILNSGPGTVAGALTAALAFYVLGLTDFRGLQELGFIAGSGILLSWIAMVTMLPACLVLYDRRREGRRNLPGPSTLAERHYRVGRVGLLERLYRWPALILLAAGVFTLFSGFALTRVAFDYNLLRLQAKGTESVAWEEKILRSNTERSSWYAVVTAKSLEGAGNKQAALEVLPAVSRVDSFLSLIPAHQEEKLALLGEVNTILRGVPTTVGAPGPVDLEEISTALDQLRFKLRDHPDAWSSERRPEALAIRKVRGLIEEFQSKLTLVDPDGARANLERYQGALARDFADKLAFLRRNLAQSPVGPQDVPPALRDRFVGKSGRFLLQVYPKGDIWERPQLTEFISEVRGVDPDVTGAPVISYESMGMMKEGYKNGVIYALIAVLLVNLYLFRRPQEALLALVPLLLGTLWTLGLMKLFDLRFNMANVFGLPLIVGAGAEYGINVVLRYLEGWRSGAPPIARSTVVAVLLNGLTTIAGFGSLMVASHQGIFSLGLLLTLGISANLLSALLVLPPLLRLFYPRASV